MTIKEAIKILDPETSADALWEIEYYCGFNGEAARLKATEEACKIACDCMRIVKKSPLQLKH